MSSRNPTSIASANVVELDASTEHQPSTAPGTVAFEQSLRGPAKLISFPVMMGSLLVAVALVSARTRLPDPDTWWHIAVGDLILKTHAWPTHDIYSFTATGAPWIAYEWVGEVAMAVGQKSGLVGLSAILMALVAVITVLMYYYAYLRCGNSKAACAATATTLPIAGAIFTLRPQLLGYVFLLVTLILLERFRQGHRKAIWFLPPLFMIWVNTHGTFAFGMAMIGLYYVSGLFKFRIGGLSAEPWTQKDRLQLSLVFLLSLLALLITPYGSELAAYPLEMSLMQPFNIANIQEWQSLTFGLGVGKYLLGLMLVFFLAHVLVPVRYRLHEIIMLLFGAFSACVHIRFVLIFMMFLAPVIGTILTQWIPPYDAKKDKPALNLIIIALMGVSVWMLLPNKKALNKIVDDDYPVGAVEYLRQHPHPTGTFNEYGYGGYLIWQLGPQYKVFIDGRADLYEYAGVFQDYMKIANLNASAMQLLSRYAITSCLVQKTSTLATLLAASPDWRLEYSDKASVLYSRVHPILRRGIRAVPNPF
jgi:hypothetical protein